MTLGELIAAKRDDICRVAAMHGARNLRLFGSAARSEAGSDSDIDLLVADLGHRGARYPATQRGGPRPSR